MKKTSLPRKGVEIRRLRRTSGSVVVALSPKILQACSMAVGDYVIVEAMNNGCIKVKKAKIE